LKAYHNFHELSDSIHPTSAVAPTGVEPALPKKLEPKSSASANSAKEPYYLIISFKPPPSLKFNAAWGAKVGNEGLEPPTFSV
jgi:hypothetical protein